MATHPDYPFASSFIDRHGTTRWRFRRAGKTASLAGQPGDALFDEDYLAAIEGRERKKAAVIKHPAAVEPGSFKDAWQRVLKTSDWMKHDDATKTKNCRLAEEFLKLPVAQGLDEFWGDMPVKDLKRRHVKAILAHYAETPHKAKHVLVAIRKMIRVALDEEWIEYDPSHQIGYRPESKGWRAWTEGERQAFEDRWPLGSAARTAYGLALWLGNRRSDVARIKWTDIDLQRRTCAITQEKTEKSLVLPITPMMLEILQPLNRSTEYVLNTAYGKPFSEKSLTGMMAHWTKMAGMPPGCTMHGLRKTLGKLMAEAGSSTRQLMETLGHDDIEHAELYSREAEQAKLARDGMAKLSKHIVSLKNRKRDG